MDTKNIDAVAVLRKALIDAITCMETLDTIRHVVSDFPALDNARAALTATDRAATVAKDGGEVPEPVLAFGDWLNEPNSRDETIEVRDYRFEAYRRWRDAVGAHRKPEASAATEPRLREMELEAALIAYASEFPLTADGEPDVGNIHANIRKLKAELRAATQQAGEVQAWMWRERADEFNNYQGRDRLTREKPTATEAVYGATPLYLATPISEDTDDEDVTLPGVFTNAEDLFKAMGVSDVPAAPSGSTELRDTLIELANTQHKLIEANAEIAALQLQACAVPSTSIGDALPTDPQIRTMAWTAGGYQGGVLTSDPSGEATIHLHYATRSQGEAAFEIISDAATPRPASTAAPDTSARDAALEEAWNACGKVGAEGHTDNPTVFKCMDAIRALKSAAPDTRDALTDEKGGV